jgi:hypothetical protein
VHTGACSAAARAEHERLFPAAPRGGGGVAAVLWRFLAVLAVATFVASLLLR